MQRHAKGVIVSRSKVVVLGLDGAPFRLIEKFSEKGILPNLTRLIKEGTFGCLRSSFLPISPVAWTSIFTGKNPGKHNVYDWIERKPSSYDIKTVNSGTVKEPVLWDMLNDAGISTGIFNVPITYPPRPVNGFMVSGFDAPSAKSCFTYPKELSSRIIGAVEDYPMAVREAYLPGREKEYIEGLKYVARKKKETILYLADNYDLDFYAFTLMALDHLHHKMWRFVDDAQGVSHIYDIYGYIDKIVGEIVERFPADTTFFVISDHGAGRLEGVMYVNNWLLQQGLLSIKGGPGTLLKKFLQESEIIPKTYKAFSKFGLGKILKALPRGVQHSAATSFFSFQDVDWMRTKAYSFGEYGQIRVNLKGREPQGIVEPGEEYEKTVELIIKELSGLKDPVTGKHVISKVHRRDEIYSGTSLHNAPDILFEIKGLSFDSSVSFGFKKEEIFGKPEFLDSGTHRREGTVIAKGRNIKQKVLTGEATILDIAPTILYSMGIGIPEDMDGKVLEEIFREEILENNPPKYTGKRLSEKKAKKDLSRKEEKEVKRKLKSLGYLG